jgi:cytoskeletal protein CcmA (bactofilin family)
VNEPSVEGIPEREIMPDGTCAIAAGTSFEGLLTFWGTARVDGRLRGEVAAEGTLEVGPEGAISARIEVDALVVEGLVEGEVLARERLEVRPGGRVTAAVRTSRLLLDEGGRLEGRVEMTRPPGRAGAAAPAA